MRPVTLATILAFIAFLMTLGSIHVLYGEEWMLLTRETAAVYGTEIYEIMPPFTQIELVPEVCIFVPLDDRIPFKEKKYYEATEESINRWYNDLTIWVGHDKDAFRINVKVIDPLMQSRYSFPNDFPDCNIFIHYSFANPDPNDAALGSTAFYFEDSKHKYADIVLYTHDLPRNVDPILLDPDPNNWIIPKAADLLELSPIKYDTMRQLVAHELGHAYGLGHYFAGENNPSRSIMEPMIDAWGDTNFYAPPQELDLYAMVYLYGYDGWYGHGFPPFERCMIAQKDVTECN